MYEHLRNEYICLSPEEEKENVELFPEEFYSIVELFREDLGQELHQIYIHDNRLFIKGYHSDKQNDLMLRLGNKVAKRLTIARVSFVNKRQGKMTKLMDMLTDIAIKEGYDSIEIEAIVTDSMLNYCNKHDLEKCPHPDLRDVYDPTIESNNRYKHLV